tara:strand:- start:340 stop:927 length:588 start_codon:yes stop_codon:yes gene_type:complete
MDTLEQIAEKREKLYIVPKPRLKYTYSGSRIDKDAYFAAIKAKDKDRISHAREQIYVPSYELSSTYKEFVPPKGFSKGSVEQCENPNIYKINYGDKTIYRAIINDKAVAFSIDKEGNFRYVSKIIDENLRNQQHLKDTLVEDDLSKVKNYVQRKHNLAPESDITCNIHKPEKEEFKPGLVNVPHYRTKESLEEAA